jgi:hypothetical protein
MDELPDGDLDNTPFDAAARARAREKLAWQLVTLDSPSRDERHRDAALELDEAFAAGDVGERAKLLYLTVLGREPEAASQAVEMLRRGLSPVLLAQTLLESREARDLDIVWRRALDGVLAGRRLRETWGLPVHGSLAAFAADPDLSLVLAAYRSAFRRPPSADELAEGRRLLSDGLGRDAYLRSFWDQPGVRSELFGSVTRDVRGVIQLLRRPRRFAAFRAHVLAVEGAAHGSLVALQLHREPTTDPSAERAEADRRLRARVDGVSAGVRQLLGEQRW